DVDSKGPGARAGLQPGDMIVEANGKPADDTRILRLTISSMAPGSQLNLRVAHNGQTQNVSVQLGELPAKEAETNEPAPRSKQTSPEPGQARLGVALTELTPEIAERLELPANIKGVVIADVQPGSAAAEAGLQVGDVIEEVSRTPVHNVSEFRSL